MPFAVWHTLPPSDNDDARDVGAAPDVSSELLETGWAKIKELKRDSTDLESEANAAGKSIWNPHGPKWKGAEIDALVEQEQVEAGSTLPVQLLMPDGKHHCAGGHSQPARSGKGRERPVNSYATQ